MKSSKKIEEYKRKDTIKKAAKIYKEIAEDDKRLSEELLSICAKCKT